MKLLKAPEVISFGLVANPRCFMWGSDSLCHTLPLSLCVLQHSISLGNPPAASNKNTSWCKLEEIFLLMKSLHTYRSLSHRRFSIWSPVLLSLKPKVTNWSLIPPRMLVRACVRVCVCGCTGMQRFPLSSRRFCMDQSESTEYWPALT